jgi:NAD(P) transhydrogenase subunit beta
MNNVVLSIISQDLYYIFTAILALMVMFGIYLMSKVNQAKTGNLISASAVFLAVIVTLIRYDILPIWLIYPSVGIGIVIGSIFALKIKMIAMPQLIALLNGLGGLASLIVGGYALFGIGSDGKVFTLIAANLAIIIGGITFFGSLVASGKLQKILPQKPLTFSHQSWVLAGLLVALVVMWVLPAFVSIPPLLVFLFQLVLSSTFGILFTIRIGGADMPIAISLLNSFSGVASAISGLAIADPLLVSIGGIVGASGLLLTQIMCRAMNRSLFEILLGKTTQASHAATPTPEPSVHVSTDKSLNYRDILQNAKNVMIVPGYGMAVAQAQHVLKQLADYLRNNGASVKYAIHPVAGRMPGHMNVLLAEADVDYDDLYEMEAINDQFQTCDLTIVVGANDVLNPAAREASDTPIYGMPILNVDQCPEIFIFNYDLRPGYSGVENPLYAKKTGIHFFLGNALDTLQALLKEIS